MSNLIVGASSGLGREIAYEFGKNSKDIILISRDINDLESLKSDIQIKYNINVDVFELDLSKLDDVKNFISKNPDLLEKIEGVLFPIGMMIDNDTIKNTEEEFTSLFSANFYSIIFFISKIINIFEKQNKGYIVGFGSISAALGRDINIGYSCAKSALENYFEGLIISNLKTKINIQFYTLGYLDTNLSSSKKLLLPKGSPKVLARKVFNNLDKKGLKKFFPNWWILINYAIKIIPFFLSKNIIKYFK